MSRRRVSRNHQVLLQRYGTIATLASLGVGASLYGCGSQSTGSSSPESTTATTQEAVKKPAFVKLERSAHPLARPENDLGPLDPNKRLSNLSLVFKLTAEQERDRDALKEAQLDAFSPSYHQWLTPEEYAARFGAKPADIERAKTWLASQGLEVHGGTRLGSRVTFSGTVAAVQAAFQTEMHRYQVGTETHYAMATAPSVPSELSDVVASIHNAHDFYLRPASYGAKIVNPDATCPTGQGCNGNGIAPPDWSNIYDVKKLYSTGIGGKKIDGTGVSIAIVGVAQIAQSDINAFRTKYALPAATVTMTLVPDTGAATPGTGPGIEAILDTEWAGGIAQKATINYVFTGANDGNVDDATFYAIENNLAPILSESWGGCEGGMTPADADLVQVYGSAAALLGITYMASSGDSGATSCAGFGTAGLYVNIPASDPDVTSVGGTQFPAGSLTYTGGTATAYSTKESVWNESNDPATGIGAGGGGISNIFVRPSYQTGLQDCSILGSLPTSATPSAMRQVPDISFTAAGQTNGIFVECTIVNVGTTQDCSGTGGSPIVVQIGGTSASAPAFAGVVALMEQAGGGGRLGNINPLLYAVNKSTPTAFHDITLGNNEVKCTSGTDPGCPAGGLYGYAAATGYDCATGIGSADVYNLVNAWATLAPTAVTIAPTPTSATEGTSINMQASVTATGTNTNPLNGTVRFAFQSYLANGQPDLTWTLGATAISGGTATAGSASLSASVPPGLVNPAAQYVDVVAEYGGDANHLSSTSPKVRIQYGALPFCISPGSGSVAAGGTMTFTASGGVGATKWVLYNDGTGDPKTGANGSKLDPATGAFTAGTAQPGYVLIAAFDGSGAETFGTVNVGSPTGSPPWAGDSGLLSNACGGSSGADAGDDSGSGSGSGSGGTGGGSGGSGSGSGGTGSGSGGTPSGSGGTGSGSSGSSSGGTSDDGGVANSNNGSSSSGCGCTTAGQTRSSTGLLGGLVLGLGLVARRRRSRR